MSMFEKVGAFLRPSIYIDYTDEQGKHRRLPLKKGHSVLDTLLDQGIQAPHSCKAGACQSCIMQSDTPANIPKEAQSGLDHSDTALGCFLPCLCKPKSTISVKAIAGTSATHTCKVIDKTLLNEKIIRLRVEAPFDFKGGQFCNLSYNNDFYRSYSIASTPEDKYLEFHIKHIENGAFSHWAKNDLQVNQAINIQGPFGKCFYSNSEEGKNTAILLCGIGTGLAPLVGVIKTAITHQHQGPINILIGAKDSKNFYFHDELKEFESKYSNIHTHWLTQSNEDLHSEAVVSDIYEYTQRTFSELDDVIVYLCGAPSFVKKMKKQTYLSGAALNNIYSDSFEPST